MCTLAAWAALSATVLLVMGFTYCCLGVGARADEVSDREHLWHVLQAWEATLHQDQERVSAVSMMRLRDMISAGLG